MRVIVTRPEPDAQVWVQALRQHGIEAIALPLISVCPLADTSSLRLAWQHLGDYTALMFVSRSAVEHFFAARPPSGPALGAVGAPRPRCWATGPGTSAALLWHGVDARRIDAPANDSGQFDSEALWQVVAPAVDAGTRVLIVRGDDDVAPVGVDGADPGRGYGRDWLAQHLVQAGAQVEFLVAYRRAVPEFGPRARDLARDAATTVRCGCLPARRQLPTWARDCRTWGGPVRAQSPPTRVLQRRRGRRVLVWCGSHGQASRTSSRR